MRTGFARSNHNGRPVVLVSPDVRPSVLGVARSLMQAGLLRRYVTTLAVSPDGHRGLLGRLIAHFAQVTRLSVEARQAPEWLAPLLELHPARELVRQVARRAGLGPISCDRVWEWAETGFDQHVARTWAGRAPCLYGCEHASVESFRRQRLHGGSNILWQVIGHHRAISQLVAAEIQKFPETMTRYTRHMQRSADRVNGRKDEQFSLADLIVANSDYVRQTFIDSGIAPDRIVAVPTGCPPVRDDCPPRRQQMGPQIFLCAGTQSLRKGTHVLLEAWRRLGPRSSGELWLVGSRELPVQLYDNIPSNVIVRPPVPRSELSLLFAQASVLVLPTFCEGRAHVVLEALAHGLPVITTANSGCGDVVRDGVNGWIVSPGDSDALAQRLTVCLDDPERLRDMGLASLEQARRWQVADFARAHATLIRGFLARRGVRLEPVPCPV